MFKVQGVTERKEVISYLQARNLLKQYRKAKLYLLAGKFAQVQFKKRKPKTGNIWSFRINKQFRAIGAFDQKGKFRIFIVDSHQ